jgi:Secretory lipase
MLVTASDYQPDDTYVVGKMEASDALDTARAGTQLITRTFAGSAPSAYDLFIWGHSQGGHAALWAGQLAESY